MEYLYCGFTQGFDLEYDGPWHRKDVSDNIPLTIGSEAELWDKMTKEVRLGRFAGPYDHIPLGHYVQSPVGLVPKAGGQTCLIFHLSYNFKHCGLINFFIPREKCRVKYRDIDHTIQGCLTILSAFKTQNKLWFGIVDVNLAFRLIPLSKKCWMLLVMKARCPVTHQWRYFINKCLPFGASISCVIFQRCSNALAHLARQQYYELLHFDRRSFHISNYLDDFLKVALSQQQCNLMLRQFQHLCSSLGIPLATEKTAWAALQVIFLGLLLDGQRFLIALPADKIDRAVNFINSFLGKKKATVKAIQQFRGLLNFLNRAIYPGCAFTRRIYSKMNDKVHHLKPHHHVNLDATFRCDCQVWLSFLASDTDIRAYCRPFIDLLGFATSQELGFYIDNSANPELGCGGIFGHHSWFFGQWNAVFMEKEKPSISYLELYAVIIGLYIWSERLANKQFIIHCDFAGILGNFGMICQNNYHWSYGKSRKYGTRKKSHVLITSCFILYSSPHWWQDATTNSRD